MLVFITLLILLKIKILLFNSQYYLNPKSKKRKLLAIANSLNLSI
nr:MAG TPA: hypothetical protein [Caudoviricetes sp.]